MFTPMHINPISVKRVELILVAALRGDGSEEDPERTVYYYYSMEGELMACYDTRDPEPDVHFMPKSKCPRCYNPDGRPVQDGG
jgi:hypothetical protein